jgi:hypothetical protein
LARRSGEITPLKSQNGFSEFGQVRSKQINRQTQLSGINRQIEAVPFDFIQQF